MKDCDYDYYLWLVQTDKGEFFMAASGHWAEAEAAQKVLQVFKSHLLLDVIGMLPRKRITPGTDESAGTIIQTDDLVNHPLGYYILAGKKIWEACGRSVEFEAEQILFNKQIEKEVRDYDKHH